MRLLCFNRLNLILRRPRSGRLEGWAVIPICDSRYQAPRPSGLFWFLGDLSYFRPICAVKRVMVRIHIRPIVACALLAAALAALPLQWAEAQTAPVSGMQISWEV